MTADQIYIGLNISQFILAILAILLSLIFFCMAKNSEKETAKTLAKITAQTGILEQITSKHMSHLITRATDYRQQHELFFKVIGLIKKPSTQETDLENIKVQQENLTIEIIASYIGLYYYCALSNVTLLYHLPKDEEELINFPDIKNLVDLSYADFMKIKGLLDQIDTAKIEENTLYNLYDKTKNHWEPHVKTSAQKYAG